MDEEPLELTNFYKTHLLKSGSPSCSVASEDATTWLPPKVFATPSWAQTQPFHRSKYYPQIGSFIILCIVVAVPLILLFTVPSFNQRGNQPFVDCTYSSRFTFQGITMPYGDMSFAEAKAIDLIYNTFLGRGLQTILAYICYCLFTSMLMRITEKQALPYELFAAIALFPAQWSVFWPCVKSCFRSCGWRTRCSLVWLFMSTIYMMLFPTIIDATSGYEAISQTRLLLPNGTSIDVSKGVMSLATENDGVYWSSSPLYKMRPPTPDITDLPPNFRWTLGLNSATIYVEGFGSEGYLGFAAACISSNMSAIWNNTVELDRPATSHTGFIESYNGSFLLNYPDSSCENWYPLAPYMSLENGSTIEAVGNSRPQEYYTSWNFTYMRDRENYECASQSRYQWGFSYAYLLLACSLNSLWLVGTWICWVDASVNSELYRKGRYIGKWRAVLDMAESLRHDLGPNTCGYSNEELENKIQKLGDIRYVLRRAKGDLLHVGLATGCEHEPRVRLEYNQEYGTE